MSMCYWGFLVSRIGLEFPMSHLAMRREEKM
jgi:hypothetical protein